MLPEFMRLRITVTLVLLILSFQAYSQDVTLKEGFEVSKTPTAPDYSKISSWAALPSIKDASDTIAGKNKIFGKSVILKTDVFFVHPTTFTYKPEGLNQWNGDVSDKKLNDKTDGGTIMYQASVFNQAGNVYAPRYRQAHYFSYQTPDTFSSRNAFDIAYSDVKDAFIYYLQNYNQGNSIIIASHSQGTNHAIRLLKEMFDGTALTEKLVCAYLVGMPVYDTVYSKLKPCLNSEQTGCYCTWRTYAAGYYPDKFIKQSILPVCTNPLTWKTDSAYAPYKLNKGGILKDMQTIIPALTDAQVQDGVLRIHKPDIRGKMFLHINNYHIADYNLFYTNVRENAALRVNKYRSKL